MSDIYGGNAMQLTFFLPADLPPAALADREPAVPWLALRARSRRRSSRTACW
jgi:hypothetical protein